MSNSREWTFTGSLSFGQLAALYLLQLFAVLTMGFITGQWMVGG